MGEGFSRARPGGLTDHPGFPRKVEPRGYLSSVDIHQLYSLSVCLSILSAERATDSFYHKDHGVHRPKPVGAVSRLEVLEGCLLWCRTGCLFCPVARQNFFFFNMLPGRQAVVVPALPLGSHPWRAWGRTLLAWLRTRRAHWRDPGNKKAASPRTHV